jgi:hypothetical protein
MEFAQCLFGSRTKGTNTMSWFSWLFGRGSKASSSRANQMNSTSKSAASKPVQDRQESGADNKSPFRIGGIDLREGQSISPAEAEELVRSILSGTPGPVTFQTKDATTGSSVSAVVNEWSDFTDGPRRNEEAWRSQTARLQEKGYLAFRLGTSGEVECKTAYRALTAQYFQDFKLFQRCQEIPDRYFRPVSSAPTWFVSHRWVSLRHPDPLGMQFRMLKQISQTDDTKLIWYDFCCIPQKSKKKSEIALFRESVQNLNSLVMATDFISIISDDYITRAWCYYEWIISQLLCRGVRASIRREDDPADYDPLMNELVLDGKIPKLHVTKSGDMPCVENLLVAGVEMFKTLAIMVTFDVLNQFGFKFGVGIASRFVDRVDFGRLWLMWQVLAGSSNHSGIKLPHLLNNKRLEDILRERHERFGTHARLYQELGVLSKRSLDMRILEQSSQVHLLSLLARARRLGPVPATYTTLAIVNLVYSLASTGDHGGA